MNNHQRGAPTLQWWDIFTPGMTYAFYITLFTSPIGYFLCRQAMAYQKGTNHVYGWGATFFMWTVVGVPFGALILLISSCWTLVFCGATFPQMLDMQAYNPGFWFLFVLLVAYKWFDLAYMTPFDEFQVDPFSFILGYYEKFTLLGCALTTLPIGTLSFFGLPYTLYLITDFSLFCRLIIEWKLIIGWTKFHPAMDLIWRFTIYSFVNLLLLFPVHLTGTYWLTVLLSFTFLCLDLTKLFIVHRVLANVLDTTPVFGEENL